MKKIVLASLFCFSSVFFAQKIQIGIKSNLLFQGGDANWSSIKTTTGDILKKDGSSSLGFNIGLSLQANLGNLFVMPELYYTNFTNKYDDPISGKELKAKNSRIDVPVLVGYSVFNNLLGVFAGPVASYNLSSDNTFADFKENATKDFTVGYQVGAQVKITKLILTAKYEGSFSKDKREFIAENINQKIKYDNRNSLITLGIGYKF